MENSQNNAVPLIRKPENDWVALVDHKTMLAITIDINSQPENPTLLKTLKLIWGIISG